MINDVTGGLHDPAIFEVAAKFNFPIVIMHSTPTHQYVAVYILFSHHYNKGIIYNVKEERD